MKSTTKECGDEVFSNYQSDSSSLDESNRGNSSGSIVLKKGPWTSAEDALLVEYVKKHGEGNWNAVQKHSGLSRCGKSCRLRWANHLRPNLKKGTFTAEEERLIIELHAKMGNKWARMATQLHGRTDNEIKNYWNTRIKRRQRAGLPLYPSDLCLQEFQENHQGQNNSGARGYLDPLHSNSCVMPEVIFDGLKSDDDALPYVSALSDISVGGMLMKCLGSSQYYGCMAPKIHHHKRLRESSDLFPISIGSVQNGFPVFDPFQNDSVNKVSWSFGPSFPNDLDPSKSSMCLDVNQGGHSLSNDNSSTSQPVSGAGKLELPSLQYPQTDLGSWGTSLLPPLHESVDEFIQSPSPLDVFESDCPLPHNSGLLDALLHEAMNLSSAKNQPSGKSSNSSINTSGDVADNCTWVEYGEPISPVGHSFNSLFNDSGGSSLDEPPPKEAFTESIVKLEPADSDLIGVQENGPIKQLDYTRPDVLLASGWLEQSSDCQGPSCRDRSNCNTSR